MVNITRCFKENGRVKLGPLCIAIIVFALAVIVGGVYLIQINQDNQVVERTQKGANKKISTATSEPKKEKRTVKIAITRDGFWFPNRNSNAINGYGGEYLKALEKKTGWHFVTKVYPLQDAYKALASGEVDVMAPVSYTKERAEQLMFMDTPSGTTRTTFYVMPNSMLAYRDYKSFSGKKIGFIKGSNSEEILKKNSELNNYSYKPVYFEDNRSLLNGILKGKADIIVAQSMCVSNREHLKVVNELQETNFFFATSGKNIEFSRKLNSAINSILLGNPEFNNTLNKRYLETSDSAEPRLTQDEMNFLRTAPTLRVAYVENLAPFQFTATKKHASACGIDGVVGRALNTITDKTGLKFSGVPYPSIEDAEEGVKAGEADIVSVYLPPEETFATDGKIISTASYLNIPVVSLSKKNHNRVKHPTIGVPYQLRWTIPILRKEQPLNTYIQFPSGIENVKALQDDELDNILCGTLMADTILENPANKNIKVSEYTNLVDKLSFGVSERQNENLVRIINKTIVSFDSDERNLFISDPTQASSSLNLKNFILGNWAAVLLAITIVVLIIIAILYNARRENLKEVEYIAFIDPITSLPNRSKFVDYVADIIEKEEHFGGAVGVLDIDSFKSINDMYGMSFGDELLKFIGEKLQNASPENTFIARDSGDVFLIYIRPETEENLQDTLKKIIGSVNRISFKHAGTLDLSISAGIYKLTGNENPNAAINCADIARGNIKDDHGKHLMFFNEDMRAELANQTILENDLKLALERNEFELYYQPKIDLYTQTVAGFEALIRWNHPLAGVLGPAAFIPLAEKVGLIGQITEWVINESCANIAHTKELWTVSKGGLNIRDGAQSLGIQIAINLSPRDILNPHIVEQIKTALEIHNINPHALEIEITESALLSDTQTSLAVLNDMRQLGLSIALDDFGTGYSALGSLKDLPLTTVKLDRTFIRDIEIDTRSQKVLRSIVNLVKVLDYKRIAEGVEDGFQAEFLKNIGCEIVQGFYYAPGMPLNEAYQYFIASLDSPVEPQ